MSSSNNQVTIISLTVAVCVLIAVVVSIFIYNQARLYPLNANARVAKSTKPGSPSPTARRAANVRAHAVSQPSTPHHPRPVRGDFSSLSAPLPSTQLMASTTMSDLDSALEKIPSSSSAIGDADMNRVTTDVGGISANSYSDTNYTMMSAASPTDVQSIQSFMPLMNDGVNETDPTTGLPLLTTGKLIRSQLLGGHGPGSFLRQQQDPLSGYRRLGKNMCGAQSARRDLAVRRAQFNQARLNDPSGDPVLFQSSEFAYQ